MDTNDGWIEWRGGVCPVDSFTRVDIRRRNGTEYLNFFAYQFWWGNHSGSLVECDIAAYRLPEMGKQKNEHSPISFGFDPGLVAIDEQLQKLKALYNPFLTGYDPGQEALEPPVTFPTIKYNVYRPHLHGPNEYHGTVEIEDRPGMTDYEKRQAAHDALVARGMNFILVGAPDILILHRVAPSTGRRRGFLK